MEESVSEQTAYPTRKESAWTGKKRAAFLTRIIVAALLVYLASLVIVGRFVTGDLNDGFYWPSSGWKLFPLPIDPNFWNIVSLPAFRPLDSVDYVVYLLFVGHWIWILWMVVGVLYLLRPLYSRLGASSKVGSILHLRNAE